MKGHPVVLTEAHLNTHLTIWNQIVRERGRQWARYGPPEGHYSSDKTALAVLMEEVGEVARAVLEGRSANLEEELIQVAATAVAWLEGIAADYRTLEKTR